MNSPFDLHSKLVPAAKKLPSNQIYLAHINVTAENPDLIRLSSNEMRLPPSPRVRAALARAYEDANLYMPQNNALRDRLAELHQIEPTAVLISAGVTEVMDAMFRAFVGKGESVLLCPPSWAMYWLRLQAIEASILEVPQVVSGNRYHYDVETMLAALTPDTKLIVVCTPNNPTGNSMAIADIRRLADTGHLMLLDNAYHDFDQSSSDDLSTLVHEYENVLVAYTFSKAYSLAGLRLGYLIGAPEVLDYIDRLMVPGSSVSSAAIYAALAALDDDEYKQARVESIISERERLIRTARELGHKAFESGGNFFSLDVSGSHGDPHAFAAAIQANGVVLRVMSGMLRITVGTPAENDVLIKALRIVSASAP